MGEGRGTGERVDRKRALVRPDKAGHLRLALRLRLFQIDFRAGQVRIRYVLFVEFARFDLRREVITGRIEYSNRKLRVCFA